MHERPSFHINIAQTFIAPIVNILQISAFCYIFVNALCTQYTKNFNLQQSICTQHNNNHTQMVVHIAQL